MLPVDVVQKQLEALQRGAVHECYEFASSAFRRVAGPRQRFEKIVREAPEYKPLVNSERYQVVSALQVGPRRYKCRVRVHNVVGRMPFSVEYRWELTRQSATVVEHDLGQCLKHREKGYRGVVVGWDEECKQTDEWCQSMQIDSLPGGRAQPFYHVLVDRRDGEKAHMAYVAQASVEALKVQPIDHPNFLGSFTGDIDTAKGTWTPSQLLREQYPLGLEGCWLVNEVFPDRLKETFDV